MGVAWLQSTIGNGTRSSAATSYLSAEFINRHNLHILLGTRVTRVLQTDTTRSTNADPSFRTVEIAKSISGINVPLLILKVILIFHQAQDR